MERIYRTLTFLLMGAVVGSFVPEEWGLLALLGILFLTGVLMSIVFTVLEVYLENRKANHGGEN